MSIVPSLSDEQRLQWKKEFRALLRSCGKQQQEVAIDMARIISTSLPEPLQDNAFISSLSRFVNGRDSAFPSWFYKEESRLLPMSQAMGLQNTEPIWNLLQNITGGMPADSGLWHPAFPQVSVEIPVLVGGKPISNIAESIVHKQKRLGQTLTCWLYGAKGVGKSYAAKQLVKRLSEHRVSSCILTHPMDTQHDVQIICCVKRPDIISRDELYYRIAGWGNRELRLLFLALEATLSPVQKSRGSAFLSLVEKESRYMGGVHTAFDVIYLLQAVLTQGIPESPAHSRIVFLQYFWSHFSLHNEGLRALHLEDWAAFWAKAFVLRWPKPCDSLSYEETLQLLSTLASGIQLNRHQALGLLQQISMSNKKARDQAIQTLSLWLSRSSEEYMLEVLLRVKLLASDQNTYFCPHIGLARRFAILGFARQSELSLPIEIILDPHWPTLLKELCILGLSQSVLMQWLLERSDDLTFEIASTILRFAVYVPNSSIEPEVLVSAWSSTLYAETHRLFFSADPSVNDDLPVVLQEASIRYVDILPVLSMKESLSSLECIVSPTIRTLCRSWGSPPLRAVQALAPLQCPPKSYAEWQEWTILPPKGVQAWEVLVSYAERGAEWAVELLSEGRGDSSEPWIRVPLIHRVSWLAQVGVRTNTFRALQICCIEFWSEAPIADPFWIPKHTHVFQDMLLRIDNIEELLSSWVQPSALAQQIVLEETTRLAYCGVWIAEYKGYLQAIQRWFTVVYEWVVSGVSVRDGLITYQQRSIPARGIREDTLRLGLQRFLLRLGQVLYDAGEASFLLALWSGQLSIDDSLEQKLFRHLLERKDRHDLERWIEQAPRL
ncbi:MAG: hypothetical protein VX278_16405, partial [Myxococcota bacterium]|nr:hypothetical protein [Myxococcota bacterium]